MAYLVRTDGSVEMISKTDLPEVKAMVGGKPKLEFGRENAILWVKEDGEQSGLPINTLAMGAVAKREEFMIFGDVVIGTEKEFTGGMDPYQV